MFNPGELPLVLLALAETAPMKAAEFMAELERLFGPDYRPSPGGVYPAVIALTDEGLLAAERDGRGKRFSLTAAGRDALEKRRRQLAAIEERTGARLREEGSLRPALDRFAERAMKVSGRVDTGAVVAVLERAVSEIEALAEAGRDGRKRHGDQEDGPDA